MTDEIARNKAPDQPHVDLSAAAVNEPPVVVAITVATVPKQPLVGNGPSPPKTGQLLPCDADSTATYNNDGGVVATSDGDHEAGSATKNDLQSSIARPIGDETATQEPRRRRRPRPVTDNPSTWTVDMLRDKLGVLGLPVYGNLEQLRERYLNRSTSHTGSAQRNGQPLSDTSTPVLSTRTRQPPWTINEVARLIEVLSDPEVIARLAQSEARRTRLELDNGVPDLWGPTSPIVRRFNENRSAEEEFGGRGSQASELANIDPAIHPYERPGEALKAKYVSLKSDYTLVYSKWSASGQNDPDNFQAFNHEGRLDLLYMFHVVRACPALEPFVLRTLPFGREVGAGSPPVREESGPSVLVESLARRRKVDFDNASRYGGILLNSSSDVEPQNLVAQRSSQTVAERTYRDTKKVAEAQRLLLYLKSRKLLDPSAPTDAQYRASVDKMIDDLLGKPNQS